MEPFFPNVWFGWIFYATLMIILVVASYCDLKTYQIPKSISIVTLILGVVINIVRGIWVGIEFHEGDWLYGLGQALLESAGGFATGFGIFLVLWLLNLTGGGDVKLFAAVAAWLTYKQSFWLWFASMVAMILIAGGRLVYYVLTAGMSATRRDFSSKDAMQGSKKAPKRPRKRIIPYSLPLAIAAALLLLWFYRVELQLEAPRANQSPASLNTQP